MKTILRAACVGLILLATSSHTWGQGMNVALLDVGYIFKNHPGFNAKMEAMKAEVQGFEEVLKKQQLQIQANAQQISAFKAGSEQYKKIEEDTTKQLADLKVKTQLKRKEIMENEAKIYLATYKEVYSMVEAYAKQRRIDLVLRYDRASNADEIADPRETLKIINRPVIYNDQLDISGAILEQFGGVATRPKTVPTR